MGSLRIFVSIASGLRYPMISSLIAVGAAFGAPYSHAQTSQSAQPQTNLGTAQDCTQIQVDYANDPTLTDAEKLALMDRALFTSLSRYDACANQTSNASADGGSGSGGGGMSGGDSGGGGSDGSSGEGTSSASDMTGNAPSTSSSNDSYSNTVASADMSGTERPQEDVAEEGDGGQTSSDAADAGLHDSASQDGTSLDNGKLPEDIPAANNDSVLESQIRQAAINETDPEVQAKLWNEYRRYKGLPIKK